MRITRIATDCPDGRTCHNVHVVDGDDEWVYITGDIPDPKLSGVFPEAPHEGTIRWPRELWEKRGDK